MTRRVSGASVVAACLFVAALGTSSGRAELNVWVTPSSANYDVMLPGDTWTGSGTIWGWGDGIVCYEWKFSDNDERIGGYILAQGRIEFSTPLVSHTFANVGHFEVTLSAWWQNEGRGAETVNGRDVWVVSMQISSETDLSAPDGTPSTRTELGIAELATCTVTVDPANTPGPITWDVVGAGKPGPLYSGQGTPTGPNFQLAAKRTPGDCTVTAHLGRAFATRGFTVIAPNDVVYTPHSDVPPGTGGAAKFMGCVSWATLKVHPLNVSFRNASLREHWQPLDITFPNGTRYIGNEGYLPYQPQADNGGLYDEWSDPHHLPLPLSLLDGCAGDVFEAAWSIPHEYLNEDGVWCAWLPNGTHFFEYKAGTGKGGARASAQASARCYGGWMGPFETINPD